VETPPNKPNPLALAIEWVAKITTVSLEMFLPAVLGAYLDNRWDTRFLAVSGLVLGVVVGLWHLIVMTGGGSSRRSSNSKRQDHP
jgi:hypothetical protein